MGAGNRQLLKIVGFLERMNAQSKALGAAKAKVASGTHRWHNGDLWQITKSERPQCGARTRVGGTCQARAMAGGKRCRMHGGKGISGPKTEAGRQAIADANRRRRKITTETPAQDAVQATDSAEPLAPTNTQPAVIAPVETLTEAQERAVTMLAEDTINDADIARQCGVSRRTLARWKCLPLFVEKYNAAWEIARQKRMAKYDAEQAQRKAEQKAARQEKAQKQAFHWLTR